MTYISLILIALLCVVKVQSKLPEVTQVKIDDGILNGTIETSRAGNKYLSFKGIPYAKPPVGELRFKAPEPPIPWKGIKNAHRYGNVCLQKEILTQLNPPVIGNEDCLFLNVYARISLRQKLKTLPVMVFIHWGALQTGNGNAFLGPQYFMDQEVLLVTFNYRLGVLGLLSTGDDASPGNYAFKDQRAVLKWIHDNIKAFGGDPDNVTLFGQSAGASSTHLHILSPRSKGLFHKAISQSGTALRAWPSNFNDLQLRIARRHAEIVNCNLNVTNHEMIDCLRSIDGKTLIESTDSLRFFYMEPLNLYTPVKEKNSSMNPEPFLEKSPLEYIIDDKFNKVPWIVGVVKDEGILYASPFLKNPEIKESLLMDFDNISEKLTGLSLSVNEELIEKVWNNISQFYFTNRNPNTFLNESKSIQSLIDLYSDRAYFYGTYESVLLHASKGHKNLYFYHFDYRGKYTYADPFALTKDNIDFNWGVCHCDDLIYLFNNSVYFDKELSGKDKEMSEYLVDLWTHFATYGQPTFWDIKWRPIKNLKYHDSLKNKDLDYLNITGPGKVKMNNEFYKKRMLFYENLPLNENVNKVHEKAASIHGHL